MRSSVMISSIFKYSLCLLFLTSTLFLPAVIQSQTIIKSGSTDYRILYRSNSYGISSFDTGYFGKFEVSIVGYSAPVEYWRPIIQFNISGLTGSVNSARFHVYSGARSGNDFDVDIYGSTINRNDFINYNNSSSTDEFFDTPGYYTKLNGTEAFIETSDPAFEWYTINITSFINNRISHYQSNPADSIVIIKLQPDGSYSSGNTSYNFSSGQSSSSKPFLSIYKGDATQEIAGSEGWRMLATPTSDNSYADLLESLWTQGIATGANATIGDASVQIFKNSTFTALSNLNTTMTPGEGFIAYVFDDENNDGTPDGFPKTISVTGTENSGNISLALTSGSDAWTLLGNPYAFSIDWDRIDKTDITETVYVYDHSYSSPTSPDAEASNSAGSYRVWNGTTGSLNNGYIATMQGFWVQNESGSPAPSLTFKESDKASQGVFYKESNQPLSLRIDARMDGSISQTYFSFNDNGLNGKDNFDALNLQPLDFKDYLSISTLADDTELAINNLPTDFDTALEIPLNVTAYQADASTKKWLSTGGTVTLSWAEVNLPKGWSVIINDYKTGHIINLKEHSEYTFTLAESKKKVEHKSSTILKPIVPIAQKVDKRKANQRFTITIAKDQVVSNEEISVSPAQFSLQQNYPNPFNPTTSIQFSVAETGPVLLTIYNVMGQQVKALVNETKTPGTYRTNWDASSMASGIYYYRLQAGNEVITRQMTLIK